MILREKKGVALGFESSDSAPRVLAVASGLLVDVLLRIAEKHNIAVYSDPDLAESLSALKPGVEIPERLFKAVAEVLAYVYRINDEFRRKISTPG